MTAIIPHILRVAFLAALVASGAPTEGRAGMEAPLEPAYQRLMDMQEVLKQNPSYRDAERLKAELQKLTDDFLQIASSNPDMDDPRMRDLLRRIDDVQSRLDVAQKQVSDFAAAGEADAGFFPNAQYPVAVFTFEDPEATGLGNAASFLLSKSMLFSAPVFSFAVVDFQADLSDESQGGLAYFDKVDALTRGHGFVLSVWGHISDEGSEVAIDTFAQLSGRDQDNPFVRTVRLPEAMGGGELRVRVKPDRFKIKSLRVGKDAARLLQEDAKQVATLRDKPDGSGSVVGRIEKGPRYSLVGSQGQWVEVAIEGGARGWTSVSAYCLDACREFVSSADFANEMVAFSAGVAPLSVDASSTTDTRAIMDEMRAMRALDGDPALSVDIAKRWVFRDALPEGGAVPGGAAFANLLAVARIAQALRDNGSEFDSIELDRGLVAEIADDLAQASVADPSDLDVLENLARLFGYLGDERRRALASGIAASIKARN